MSAFEKDLQDLINKYNMENGSDTPDFILAEYLEGCLVQFNLALLRRSKWYGRYDRPGLLSVKQIITRRDPE